MKRLLKSWVFWAFAVPVMALPFVCRWRTEEVGHSCICGSGRIERNSRVDVLNSTSFRGKPHVVRFVHSTLWTEFLQDVHAHDYGFFARQHFQDSEGRGFVSACRRDLERHLWRVCGESPEFVRWLKSEVAEGRMNEEAIEVELLKDTDYPEGVFPFGWSPP